MKINKNIKTVSTTLEHLKMYILKNVVFAPLYDCKRPNRCGLKKDLVLIQQIPQNSNNTISYDDIYLCHMRSWN